MLDVREESNDLGNNRDSGSDREGSQDEFVQNRELEGGNYTACLFKLC
jgi:hypothetical protein